MWSSAVCMLGFGDLGVLGDFGFRDLGVKFFGV